VFFLSGEQVEKK